jgi:hypothetical protein
MDSPRPPRWGTIRSSRCEGAVRRAAIPSASEQATRACERPYTAFGLPPTAVRMPRNAIGVLAGAFGVLRKGGFFGSAGWTCRPGASERVPCPIGTRNLPAHRDTVSCHGVAPPVRSWGGVLPELPSAVSGRQSRSWTRDRLPRRSLPCLWGSALRSRRRVTPQATARARL